MGDSQRGPSGARDPDTIHGRMDTLRGEDLAYGNRRLSTRISHKHWNQGPALALYPDLSSRHPCDNPMELCPQRLYLQVSQSQTYTNEHPMETRELAPGSIVERHTKLIVVIVKPYSSDSLCLTRSGPLFGYVFMSDRGVKWRP
jgi:hypothetical protein